MDRRSLIKSLLGGAAAALGLKAVPKKAEPPTFQGIPLEYEGLSATSGYVQSEVIWEWYSDDDAPYSIPHFVNEPGPNEPPDFARYKQAWLDISANGRGLS